MSTMHTLDSTIENIREQGRPLTIGYTTACFPAKEDFAHTLKSLADRCDIIEIAIPFSDPVADSPTAEHFELEAVKRGVNLQTVFNTLETLPAEITCRLVLAGYYNNFLQYGLSRLATNCQRFSITALLVYDLPFGEYADIQTTCPDLRLIPLLATATSDERLQAYAEFPAPYSYIVPAIEASGAEKALNLCAAAQKKVQQLFRAPVGIRYDAMTLPEPIKQQMPILWYESSLLEHIHRGKGINAYFGACCNTCREASSVSQA